MARNKYPEETVEKIIDTATRLFMENGYENTTIQDIIDGLGGLTKGAIYHHFKGKEQIMVAVSERLYASQDQMLEAIRDAEGLTGMEKLRKLFRTSFSHPGQADLFSAAPNMRKNPQILVRMMEEAVESSAPAYIRPIIEMGVQDGSIQTAYPEELAEVLMLLTNLWANPMVFQAGFEKTIRKARYLNEIAAQLGLPELLDESMFQLMEQYYQLYQEKQE